ncbi:MAG: hypothetical protein R3C49_12910 [Planctomycetaceae bacterium]
MSDAYQRPFDPPEDIVAAANLVAAVTPELQQQRPELLQAAKAATEEYSTATDAWYAAEAATLPAAGELDAARNAYAEAKKKADEARKAAGGCHGSTAVETDGGYTPERSGHGGSERRRTASG